MNNRFAPHGDYSITVVGNLMEVTAYGNWNAECAQEMYLEAVAKAQLFNGQPWGSIINLHGWSLGTPDFGDEIKKGALTSLRWA